MTTTSHVTKLGHKCHNPYGSKGVKATDVINGASMRFGAYNLFARYSQEYGGRKTNVRYIVRRNDFTGNEFEFFNFDCAAAKLHELGKAHASNSFDSMMNN